MQILYASQLFFREIALCGPIDGSSSSRASGSDNEAERQLQTSATLRPRSLMELTRPDPTVREEQVVVGQSATNQQLVSLGSLD
jgi:hypothetical protein